MHQVEDFAQVAPEPVEGVHDDDVAGPGVPQESGQALPVDGGTGLLVGEDPFAGNAGGGGEGVELAVQALLGRRDSGVPELEAARGVRLGGDHLSPYRKSTTYQLFGTHVVGRVLERLTAGFRAGDRIAGRVFHF